MPTIAANWLRSGAIPAGVIIAWTGTNASVPVNWSRVTSLDGRFVKQIASSVTAPGATGGSATHAHPFQQHATHTYNGHNHAGSWGDSAAQPNAGGGVASGGAVDGVIIDHLHHSNSTAAANITVTNNSSINTDTFAQDPLHVTTIFIQSNGAAVGIPVNGVVWYNGAAPTGFSVLAAFDNRLMKGAAGGADGGTSAGTDPTAHTHTVATHTHPVTAHTHTVALDPNHDRNFDAVSGANNKSVVGHPHTLGTSSSTGAITSDAATETTGTGDGTAPWQKMRAVQKITSPGTVPGIIAMWLGTLATIPAGWKLCDGTASTPNLSQDKYVRGAATDGEVGNTGGATTHTHAAGTAHSHGSTTTHSHTFTGASGTDAGGSSAGSGADSFVGPHAHNSTTYTSSTITIGTSTANATAQQANTSNDPLFTGVAYIQLA